MLLQQVQKHCLDHLESTYFGCNNLCDGCVVLFVVKKITFCPQVIPAVFFVFFLNKKGPRRRLFQPACMK